MRPPNPLKDHWRRLKRFARTLCGKELAQRVQIRCPTERHGSDLGGWVMVPAGLTADSVVYSVGIGDDISFDLSLIRAYSVQVHAFDPTPRSLQWLQSRQLPDGFHVHEFGLAATDGTMVFSPPENPAWVSYTMLKRPATAGESVRLPVHRLGTIMKELDHERIDILKLDIEGAEYGAVMDMLDTGAQVGQLLVEFHHRFPGVELEGTRRAIQRLNDHGYRIFHRSANGENYGFLGPGHG